MVAQQNAWEFSCLLEIYRDLAPMVMLEIGTSEGGTLMQWAQNAPVGARIGSLDPAEPAHWPNVPGVLTTYFRGSSHDESIYNEVVKRLPVLDFLFIDGDHTFDGVRLDWEMYSPLVREGGLVALHDIYADEPGQDIGVNKLWERLKRKHKTIEIMDYSLSDPRIPGWPLGIGVVQL